jgi:hypothetical protein
MGDPIFVSNEAESEEKPTYIVSRLVAGEIPPEEVVIPDEPEKVPEDRPTYIAYKVEEKGTRGTGSDDNPPS